MVDGVGGNGERCLRVGWWGCKESQLKLLNPKGTRGHVPPREVLADTICSGEFSTKRFVTFRDVKCKI